MTVYNLLGQKMGEWAVVSSTTGGSPSAPTGAASGVYVMKVSNKEHSALQKFVVLK